MKNKTLEGLNISSKTIETADSLASKIIGDAKKNLGFVPNMYGLMANNPALLDAYTHSYHTFRENSGFTSIEQEVIFLSVAYENDCEYCMGAHSFVADKMSGVPIEVTDAIREGREISNAKLNALNIFTRAMTKTRANVSSDEIVAFLNAGYNESQLLGVITGVGIKTFSNYFNHFVKTPLDEMFAGRKWDKQ